MVHKVWSTIGKLPYWFSRSSVKFQGHMRQKIADFNPNWAFRTVTQVWIHPWLWSDAQSLMYYRRGALFFFKAIHQIPRSRGTTNHQFWPELSVFINPYSLAIPVNSTLKGQWRGALMFSLICAWINGWVNTRDVVDLRRIALIMTSL